MNERAERTEATESGVSPQAEPENRMLLDNRRTPCAVGLIKAAQTMATLPVGTIMEIWSKDRYAPIEIPTWAQRDGHEVSELGRGGIWPYRYFKFEVRKVTERATAGS